MNEKDNLELELNSIKTLLEEYKEELYKIGGLIAQKQQLCKITNDKLGIDEILKAINVLENEKKVLEDKIYNLQKKAYDLQEILSKRNYRFISSNGKIDLYKRNSEFGGTYDIYLPKLTTKVGEISYFPEGHKSIFGNIGCAIIDDYRGNGYAYQALCILADYLSLNNIQNITLTVKKNNIASIKTLDKFKNYVLDTKIVNYYVDNVTGEKDMSILVYNYKLRRLENKKMDDSNTLDEDFYEHGNKKI